MEILLDFLCNAVQLCEKDLRGFKRYISTILKTSALARESRSHAERDVRSHFKSKSVPDKDLVTTYIYQFNSITLSMF